MSSINHVLQEDRKFHFLSSERERVGLGERETQEKETSDDAATKRNFRRPC